MAAPMLTLRRCLLIVRECRSQTFAARTIHKSYVAAKNKQRNGKPVPPSSDSEKDKLMDAAAEVAASMPGIENEAFTDLSDQLFKMDAQVEERRVPPKDATQVLPKKVEVLSGKQVKENVSLVAKLNKDGQLNERQRVADTPPALDSPLVSAAKNMSEGQIKVTSKDELEPRRKHTPFHNTKERQNSWMTNEGKRDDSYRRSRGPTGQSGVESRRITRDERSVPENARSESLTSTFPERKQREFKAPHERSRREFKQSPWMTNEGKRDESYRRSRGAGAKSQSLASDLQRMAENPDGALFGKDLLDDVEPLNIFNPSKWSSSNEGETVPLPDSWVQEYANQITDSQTQRFNGFEDMIAWTKEEKLWQFPINNEQGMEEELNTPFYEHVFLDKHLSAFPATGPIRRFMELVTLGLSKNPHLSVKEKVAHIDWFKDYFQRKQPLVPSEQLLAETAV